MASLGKKLFLGVFIPLIIMFFGLVGFSYWWYTQQLLAISTSTQPISFVVQENVTAQSVLADLEAKQLIRSQLAARVYLRLHTPPQVRPGVYQLSPNQSLPEILSTLASRPKDLRVTFPEGWRHEQFASRLAETYGSVPASKFSAAEFLNLTSQLEGQLFPDTYYLPADASTAQVVSVLTNNFTKKTGLTLPADNDTLIIASLIERESRRPEERPVISGIIKNRLDQGWLLNIDATIQYAKDSTGQVAKYWQPITDTKYPSIYNTYTHLGLPPTPICNPGLSSIEAAKNPEATQYMFYLHDSAGQVHYATTLAGHNANVDKYLKP